MGSGLSQRQSSGESSSSAGKIPDRCLDPVLRGTAVRHRLAVVLVLVVALGALSVAPAAGEHGGRVLDEPRNGSRAVQELGQHIAEIARTHDTTGAELRQRLEHDLSLWVDTSGRLFYVDPTAPDHVDADASTLELQPSLTTADPFALHSRPDAKRTVYLDFNGHGGQYGGAVGGAWSSGYTGGDGVAEPYSVDTDLSFSAGELDEIRSVWQRVAEDFAPFDVNVTTAQPDPTLIDRSGSSDTLYGTRVAITSTKTDCGCGGVAYVGVFDYYGRSGHAHYQPAFVYTRGAKNVAEAASHEAGHNLGLSHDGTSQSGYYPGHGDWAPIMGVGYYQPITQWSRGEYAGANNTEDDFAVAGSNGAPLRADETSATAATVSSTMTTPVTVAGTIERAADTDELPFTADDAATVTITAAPAATSPNLDIKLTLRTAAGTLVAEADPLSSLDQERDGPATGLGAALSAQVAAGGSYIVSVDGVGAHDPATNGYSGYGSLGDYTVSITGAAGDDSGVVTDPDPDPEPPGEDPPTTPTAPAAPTLGAVTVSGSTVTVTWTDNADNETGFEVRREKRNNKGTWAVAAVLPAPLNAVSFDDSPGSGTFRYSVRAVNTIGPSVWDGPSGAVTVSSVKGSRK